MLKIVVFDGGWGGELVANYLDNELNIVEIVRVIDWAHGSYANKNEDEIFELAEKALAPYINRCDLIVLGGFAVSLAQERLEKLYEKQKFVGMEFAKDRFRRFPRRKLEIALLASNDRVIQKVQQQLLKWMPQSQIHAVNCRGWEEMIDENRVSGEFVNARLVHSGLKTAKMIKDRRQSSAEKMSIGARIKLKKSESQPNEEKYALARAVQRLSVASEIVRAQELDVVNEEMEKLGGGRKRMPKAEAKQADLIVVADTHFWELTELLETTLGWNARMLDSRQRLLRNVCAALGLQGVDGNRPK